MPVKKLFVLAVFTAAIIVTSLPAQEGGLTIEKAVEIALARNPDILAARNAIEASRGRRLQLASRPEPQLLGERRGSTGSQD